MGNYWLLRLPDYCSNKHPPASAAGLVDSAGQRGGSGAVLLSCSPAKPNLPGPSPADPRQAAEMGEQVTEKLQKQTSENKPLISESVAETRVESRWERTLCIPTLSGWDVRLSCLPQ